MHSRYSPFLAPPPSSVDLCEAYYAGPTGANYSYQALVELRDYRNLQFLMSDLAVLAFDRAAKFAGERRGDGVHLQNITELGSKHNCLRTP